MSPSHQVYMNDRALLLKHVQTNIELYFPFAVTSISQTFVNTLSTNVEAIYQFPLPKEAGFISFTTVLNGETYQGVVVNKQEANRTYEKAINESNTSILLEQLEDGIFQINLGNLAPGDTVEFHLKISTMLELSGNLARYFLPTMIAPRYGKNPYKEFNGLEINFFASYKISGSIKLSNELVCQQINSSLPLIDTETPDQKVFSGSLNKDFVVSFNLVEAVHPKAFYTKYNGEYFGLSAIPSLVSFPQTPSNIQLILDCSGSMSGASILQVRKGLECMFSLFDEGDRINLIKFGSYIEEVLDGWRGFNGRASAILQRNVANLNADMGGTELIQAIDRGLDNAKLCRNSQILLLTDGQVWCHEQELQQLINRAITAEVSISVIGLGNGVNERFLQKISQATGGNLTLINPSENTARKVALMLSQIKCSKGYQQFEFNDSHTWSNIAKKCIANGNTVSHFINEMPFVTPFKINQSNEHHSASATLAWEAVPEQLSDALMALVAKARINRVNEHLKEELAEKYQQITDATSFIMVAERDNRALNPLPEIVHQPQMMPEMTTMACASIEPSIRKKRTYMGRRASSVNDSYLDIPAFLRTTVDDDFDVELSESESQRSEHDMVQFLRKLSNLLNDDSTEISYFLLRKLKGSGVSEDVLASLINIFSNMDELLQTAHFAEFVMLLDEHYGPVLSDANIARLESELTRIRHHAFNLEQRKLDFMLELFD